VVKESFGWQSRAQGKKLKAFYLISLCTSV